MSRTYRDQRRWRDSHRHWIRAYEPGRNRWERPGKRIWWKFFNDDYPDRAYLRRTRHQAKDALRHGNYESVELTLPRRYNSHE